MKKIVLWTVGIIVVTAIGIAEQHYWINNARGEWKTEWLLSEGLTDMKYPELCFYCDYIKPLISKLHEQEKK